MSLNHAEYPYLCRLAHQHLSFRLPEFYALAELFGVREQCKLPSDLAFLEHSPFLPVAGIPESTLKLIVGRSILIKSLYYCYARASSREALVDKVKSLDPSLFRPFASSSFKFTIDAFGKKHALCTQHEMILDYSFLPLSGPVELEAPKVTFSILTRGSTKSLPSQQEAQEEWYLCRLLSDGNRSAMDAFDLKKRNYIGITSMNAELSLIMSNMAKLRRHDLMYDPFLGTGSFMVTSSFFGAYSMGSDIDGRQMRGKGHGNIYSNTRQYGLGALVLDAVVFDSTLHPWRDECFFDAIITDPPYGVRAGAKRITSVQPNYSHEDYPLDPMNPRYPKTEPYPTEQVMIDLVSFAARHLRVGGRLVYWQPTVAEEAGAGLAIPSHESCMKLIAASEQQCSGWSRWMVTMEKMSNEPLRVPLLASTKPKLRHFRDEFYANKPLSPLSLSLPLP